MKEEANIRQTKVEKNPLSANMHTLEHKYEPNFMAYLRVEEAVKEEDKETLKRFKRRWF